MKKIILILISIFTIGFCSCEDPVENIEKLIKESKTLDEHSDCVNSVCWSPDGRYLASGSVDNDIIIWNVNNGERVRILEGHSYSVFSISWSPNGKYLASSSEGFYHDGIEESDIFLWDPETGEILQELQGNAGYANCITWSPDGKYLLEGSGSGAVRIWSED